MLPCFALLALFAAPPPEGEANTLSSPPANPKADPTAVPVADANEPAVEVEGPQPERPQPAPPPERPELPKRKGWGWVGTAATVGVASWAFVGAEIGTRSRACPQPDFSSTDPGAVFDGVLESTFGCIRRAAELRVYSTMGSLLGTASLGLSIPAGIVSGKYHGAVSGSRGTGRAVGPLMIAGGSIAVVGAGAAGIWFIVENLRRLVVCTSILVPDSLEEAADAAYACANGRANALTLSRHTALSSLALGAGLISFGAVYGKSRKRFTLSPQVSMGRGYGYVGFSGTF